MKSLIISVIVSAVVCSAGVVGAEPKTTRTPFTPADISQLEILREPAIWLQGHNEDGMFKALVSHAGGADRWSAYGTTEELWFPEWEMYGPPWENPELMDKLSPIREAKNFSTPQLITHGDLDYRVRVTGGEAMFTALPRLGVPSRMIRFPDENHWIMKPENQKFWSAEILAWFDQWLGDS